jgi:hypothetical protein
MNFDEHCELAHSLYKQLAKRYNQKGDSSPNYQLGYLQGMLCSLWSVLELSDEQKKLFNEYLKSHLRNIIHENLG